MVETSTRPAYLTQVSQGFPCITFNDECHWGSILKL